MRRVELFPHREKISPTWKKVGAGERVRAEFGGSQREGFAFCSSVVWEGQNPTSWRGSVFSLGNNILEGEWLPGMGNWSIDLLT